MKRSIPSTDLKAFAKRQGADLVGIAPLERFEYLPPEENPASIFPDAKTVVVLGMRIPRGTLRGIEEGTYWAAYSATGYGGINQIYMPILVRSVSLYLEDHGWEAVPYINTFPGGYRGGTAGQSVAPGRPGPDIWLNFRAMAAAAGLGEIGWSKVFLTPEFGPRQRFAVVITDAPLEPDPLFDGQICDRCMLCVRDCPGAIQTGKPVSVEIEGRRFEWNRLDVARCTLALHGAVRAVSPFLKEQPELPDIHAEDDVDAYEKAMVVVSKLKGDVPYYRSLTGGFPGNWSICGGRGCMRTCMDHLESEGRIQAGFNEPFRKRSMWTVD